MTRATRRRDEYKRHEVEVVKRRPITQRNLVSPPPQRPDDDAETFGGDTKASSIVVSPKRDRTPKGVSDGRGKRSVADVLFSIPDPEGKAVYAMERIASLEDQIQRIIDLCNEETKAIIFKRRASLKVQYGD
jgi:hypothetical protein